MEGHCSTPGAFKEHNGPSRYLTRDRPAVGSGISQIHPRSTAADLGPRVLGSPGPRKFKHFQDVPKNALRAMAEKQRRRVSPSGPSLLDPSVIHSEDLVPHDGLGMRPKPQSKLLIIALPPDSFDCYRMSDVLAAY
ncbi:unnamed protein product [Lota lota]